MAKVNVDPSGLPKADVTLPPPEVACPVAAVAATAASVKNCNVVIIPVIVENTMTGDSNGNVMCRNRCHAVAPSIEAASYRCVGTSTSAARKMTIVLPMPHSASRVSDGLDQLGSLNHSGPSMPKTLRIRFTGP